MYILYLDESGNENDPNDRYFVLGGVALFERQTYFLAQGIDEVQRRHFPEHLFPCFPFRDGVLHGLVHVRSSRSVACDCPACNTRRNSGNLGSRVTKEPTPGYGGEMRSGTLPLA